MDSPLVQEKRGVSPIWILPLIALSIGAWLLYTSYRDAGIPITIHFDNAEGITAGKTQVMYKGVAVGLVGQITVDDDLQGVNLVVKIEKRAKRGLVEDTKFWVVKPEISAGRISGLETILTGSYIAVQPGNSTVKADAFEGLPEPPTLPPDSPGLHLTLRADSLHSLQKGSPVYTRNLKIGKVKSYKITEDSSILIDIYIEPEFSHLIHDGTRFWNSSGISFEGNLQSGFNLNMESLASLVYGGISCGTPESLETPNTGAVNGMVFQLFKNFDSAEYGLPMMLQLASGGGIVEGKTRVMYRGLEAGVVKKIKLNNDEHHTVTAEILLDPRAEAILKAGTRFWVIRPEVSIDGIRNLETIIAGPYISLQPGEGEYQDHFIVEQGPMPQPQLRTGKHFTLVSRDSGFLEVGAPILYKKMVVGEIYSNNFGPDAESVHTGILIYDEYASFVQENSIFWNVSGIEIDAGISHLNINLSSIRSILAGGITFTNIKQGPKNKANLAQEGHLFPLYNSFTQATKNNPGLRSAGTILKLLSTANNTFDVGSPVLYKKIPIGEVLDFSLSKDRQSIIFEVLIKEKYTDLINSSTRFYNFSGFTINADLSGIQVRAGPIASIVTGGISFFTPDQGKPVQDGNSFTLYENYDAALYPDSMPITIHIDKADGLRENSKIKYQGIQIGSVEKLRFTPEMKGIVAQGRINREASGLFRTDTRLWLVKPEISLFSGIRHVETVLTGAYIDVVPGQGEAKNDFTLLSEAPVTDTYAGLNLILETPRLGSLNRSSPVYYRQVRVGRVTGFVLSPTAQQVWVKINIYPAYTALIHNGTKFWLASGVKASWGFFSGLDVSSESMESLLAGGIALATPEGKDMGDLSVDGDHFPLHEVNEETWLEWSPEIVLNTAAGFPSDPGTTPKTQ